MTVKQLTKRLDDLINAHAWSRINSKIEITIGQRICITQERAALMQVLDTISPTNQFADYPVDETKIKYEVPKHLNQKIIQITAIIKSTSWTRPIYEVEPY